MGPSCLSIEAEFSEKHDVELLYAYCAREVSLDEHKCFAAAILYVDYLWTLWVLARVPFNGDFMQNYANERYKRLKKNIEKYKALT